MIQLGRSFYVLLGALVLSSAIVCQDEGEFNRGSEEHKFNKRGTHVHHHYHNDPAPAPAVVQAPARSGGMFGGGMMQNVATGTLMAGGAAFAGTAGHIAAENMFGDKKEDKDDNDDSNDHHHHESEKTDAQQTQPATQAQPATQPQPATQAQPVTQPQSVPLYQSAAQAQPAAQLPPYWPRIPSAQPQSGVEYQQVPPVPLAYLYPADTSLYAPAGSNTGFSISPNAMRSPFNSAGQSIYPTSSDAGSPLTNGVVNTVPSTGTASQ